MINKLKTTRRGKFQHPAITAGSEKLYFGRGMKNAIGNVKPYDDVTANSQCGVYCLDMSRGTHHSCMFLIGVLLGNHVDEILTQPCRNRVQI